MSNSPNRAFAQVEMQPYSHTERQTNYEMLFPLNNWEVMVELNKGLYLQNGTKQIYENVSIQSNIYILTAEGTDWSLEACCSVFRTKEHIYRHTDMVRSHSYTREGLYKCASVWI